MVDSLVPIPQREGEWYTRSDLFEFVYFLPIRLDHNHFVSIQCYPFLLKKYKMRLIHTEIPFPGKCMAYQIGRGFQLQQFNYPMLGSPYRFQMDACFNANPSITLKSQNIVYNWRDSKEGCDIMLCFVYSVLGQGMPMSLTLNKCFPFYINAIDTFQLFPQCNISIGVSKNWT